MKANQKQMEAAASAFFSAIIDHLCDQGQKVSAGKDKEGNDTFRTEVALSADVLRAAAFPALAEALGSSLDAEGKPLEFTPVQVAIIWDGFLKINESAFAGLLRTRAKAGNLPFTLVAKAERVRGMAMQYAGLE